MLPGGCGICQVKQTLAELILQDCGLGADSGGRLGLVGGCRKISVSPGDSSLLAKFFICHTLSRRQICGWPGTKRRTVLEVDGDGVEHNRGTRVAAGAQQVFQVLVEIPVNHFLSRIIWGHLVPAEHLHATPFFRPGGPVSELVNQVAKQLARPRFLEQQMQPHQPEWRRLCAKNSRGSEGADHLVVAHVNNPNITFMPGAFTGDGQDRMRVDRRYSRIDDLELFSRKAPPQQSFKVTAGTKVGPRISQRRRFA